MKPTLPRPAILAAALLMTTGAAQANYGEDFNGISLNAGYLSGETIAGSDFEVIYGVAFTRFIDPNDPLLADRYVGLTVSPDAGTAIESSTLFNLDAGVQYKLSFDFSKYSGAPGNGPFNWNLTASIAGYTTTVDGFSQFGAALEWHKVDLYFTPAADHLMVPIIFAAVGMANAVYGEAPIDNVSFSTAPVPEPGSWAMLLAGLGLVGFVARRRQA
ncbi:MAG: PEPxxWA-CTERM sorting domain-containing protein [Burkholderiaceae bacterium]